MTSRTLDLSSITWPKRSAKVSSPFICLCKSRSSTDPTATGCTPKAVSHRLANLRNHGKIAKRKGSTTLIPVRAAASPRTPRTPTSGRSRTKDTSTKKPTDNDTASEGEEDAESIVSPSDGRKRARYSKTPASYAESDAVSDDEDEPFTPKNKRVKTEPAEDEDTTDTIKDVEYFKEEDDAVAFV
jgi:hypothetical protein